MHARNPPRDPTLPQLPAASASLIAAAAAPRASAVSCCAEPAESAGASPAAAAAAAAASAGTPVPRTSILVVGGTGTLGRQIVKRALDEGYDVRCIVRPRESPADFLRDWGAQTVSANLADPASLPAALVGIHTVIDAATARPEESVSQVDWEGKVALVQAAQAMGIQKYVFFSIHDCDRHPDVPLMAAKAATEAFLAETGLDYTVFRLCGLMQGLIGNYAVPILEERSVYGTSDQTRTAYLDTQDIARMTLAALNPERAAATRRWTATLAGPKAFTVDEVIALCEDLSESRAQVSRVPTPVLRGLQAVLSGFQWARDASDRLAFARVMSDSAVISAPMDETYAALGLSEADTTTLEGYLGEYFSRILKKLRDVGAESKQTNFYV